MIRADHRKWARLLFNPYLNYLLKKDFSAFYLVNKFPQIPDAKGLIVTPNHFSWWDGFFIDYLMRKKSKRKLFIMMLEDQLERFWFFKKLGAFSINPGKTVSISGTVNYARSIIENPDNYIVIYPQGEIEPFEKNDLNIKPGLKIFIKNLQNETFVFPAAFKIQYGEDRKPFVAARFGDLIETEKILQDFGFFEKSFRDNLNKLQEAVFEKSFTENLFNKNNTL